MGTSALAAIAAATSAAAPDKATLKTSGAAKDFEAFLVAQMLRSVREEGSGWLGTGQRSGIRPGRRAIRARSVRCRRLGTRPCNPGCSRFPKELAYADTATRMTPSSPIADPLAEAPDGIQRL